MFRKLWSAKFIIALIALFLSILVFEATAQRRGGGRRGGGRRGGSGISRSSGSFGRPSRGSIRYSEGRRNRGSRQKQFGTQV